MHICANSKGKAPPMPLFETYWMGKSTDCQRKKIDEKPKNLRKEMTLVGVVWSWADCITSCFLKCTSTRKPTKQFLFVYYTTPEETKPAFPEENSHLERQRTAALTATWEADCAAERNQRNSLQNKRVLDTYYFYSKAIE